MNPEFDKLLEEKGKELGLTKEELEDKILKLTNEVKVWDNNLKSMSKEELIEELGKLKDSSLLWAVWLAFLFGSMCKNYDKKVTGNK